MISNSATDGTQVIEKLAQLYRELPYLGEMSIICSFDPWLVYKARSSIPSILVGLTHQHQVNQYTSDGVRKIDNPVFHHIAFVSARIPKGVSPNRKVYSVALPLLGQGHDA